MRIWIAIVVASAALTATAVAQASWVDKTGSDRSRTSIYIRSAPAQMLHMRAKRALGEDFACVSFRARRGRSFDDANLDLRITSRSALRKARRIASGIPTGGRVSVSVIDPRFGFDEMQSILRDVSAASPGGSVFIFRDRGYMDGPTPNGICKPVVIETNDVLSAPTPEQLIVPPEWYETPAYEWAAEQSRMYGEDRVKAYPQRFPRPA